jgi:hypothetical protein
VNTSAAKNLIQNTAAATFCPWTTFLLKTWPVASKTATRAAKKRPIGEKLIIGHRFFSRSLRTASPGLH